MPEDKGLLVVDSRTGDTVLDLSTGVRMTAAAVNDDGTKIAGLTSNSLYVWDLAGQSTDPQIYQASSIGETFSGLIEWVDNKHILASGSTSTRSLFSLDYEMVVWTYHFAWGAKARDPKLTSIVNKRLVYTADVTNPKGFAVGAVDLPGPGVAEKISEIDVESLYIMKPGSEVALTVATGEFDAEVRSALTEKIEAAGWKINDSASFKLHATMGRGEQATTRYQKTDQFGQGGGEEISVTVTPYYSSLKLTDDTGKKILWSSGTSTGAPPFLSARDGKSPQQLADELQKPYPGFFSKTNIPSKMKDPKFRSGVGSSSVGTRGIVPR